MYCLEMASEEIAQLAEALSKTHVGDGELSYKGRGLKLDNVESGKTITLFDRSTFFYSLSNITAHVSCTPLTTTHRAV